MQDVENQAPKPRARLKPLRREQIDILQYDDYRDYLRDLFESEKAYGREISFGKSAQELGSTKSYLKLIFQKKRHSSQDRLWGIAQLFELDEFDRQYLVFLFLSATSHDEQMRGYFTEVLRGLRARREYAGRHRPSSIEGESVFRGYLEMAVHSLVRLKDFQPDPHWIVARLGGDPVNPEEVSLILKDFLERGLIVERDGKFEANEFVFREQQPADRDHFKIYQIGQREAIRATTDLKRFRPAHFHMMALALSFEDEKRVLKKYIEFRDELMEIAKQSTQPDVVHFVSNNIFAVTPPEDYKTLSERKP